MNVNKFAIHSIVSTLFKTIGALIVIKIIATEVGPIGLGEISNTFSLVAFAAIFSIAGIGTGITKYVAQSEKNENIYSIIRVSVLINIAVTIILVCISANYAENISSALYSSGEYKKTVITISFLVFPLGLTVIGLAVLSGMRRVDLISKIQLFGLIVGSISMYELTLNYGLKGVILGLFFVPIVPIIYIAFLITKGKNNIKELVKINKEDKLYLKKLLPYSWITITGIVVNNGILINFRAIIEENFGTIEVGNWQAMLRISEGYSQIFMVFLMAYLLPNIARSHNNKEIIAHVNKTAIYICVGMCALFPIVSALKNQIIYIALSQDFGLISNLFNLQLLSDFFKIMSYVPGIIILGLGKFKLSVFMEILQGFILYVCGQHLISENGAIGAVYSYLMAYMLYFSIIYISYFIYIKKNEK